MQKHTIPFIVAITIILIFVLTGGGCEQKKYYINDPDFNDPADLDNTAVDTDGDGLTDVEEIEQYGTSPIFSDTDGDGLSDYKECVEYGFDPSENPYRYNPLVADVPKLGIKITSPPAISLHLTDTNSVSRTFETTRSAESASTVATSTTDTNSQAIEQTHTASASVSTDFISVTCSLSYSYSHATTNETSHSYTDEQTKENRRTLENSEAFERTSEISASGGIIMATVKIKNEGNVAFRMENLILGAVVPDKTIPGVFHPIANLNLDVDYASFPEVSVAPGSELGVLNFINDGLDLMTAKSLLCDTRSLILRPASYELTDAEGKPFAFSMQDVQAKTGTVIIDYAGIRLPEKYMVAVNMDPDNPGINAAMALGNCLHIPYQTGVISYNGSDMTGLLSVRDVESDLANINGYWLVVHSRFDGVETISTPYDTLAESYDFDTWITTGYTRGKNFSEELPTVRWIPTATIFPTWWR
jgi:hypothetical protein